MKRKFLLLLVLLSGLFLQVQAQNLEASPHDFGRMWTFENPPDDWFIEAYNFDAGEEWFDHVRKSSLRFASWCSASFVSPEGLIMTNHHCSRGVTLQLQQDGEDFTKNGFYARNLEDERKAEGLFVEQLIHAVDITDMIELEMEQDKELLDEAAAIEKIKEKYAAKADWKNLRIQIVEYYSGGKHSIYAYKRYDDIRLVLVPEVRIGFFGGEEDNFTFPRYNLDFTFWRAYDENGQPLNTSANYMQFNINGAKEGEPVFVVGNPARTERYKTVAQLEYDRDYRFPMTLDFLTALYNQMQARYDADPNPQLLGRIFGMSNSLKVYKGIQGGLANDELLGRKIAMEKILKEASGSTEPWDQMEKHLNELKPHAWAMNLLGPSQMKGASFSILHSLAKYERQLNEGLGEVELEASKIEILNLSNKIGSAEDKKLLVTMLSTIDKHIPANNKVFTDLRDGKNIAEYVDYLFAKSKFYKEGNTQKILDLKTKKFLKKKDPLLELSRSLIPAFSSASVLYVSKAPIIEALQKEIAKKAFGVYGESLPPDATFTLRISDGVVKGYEYNGTVAPYQTTFYGLYDRYFSNPGKASWDLPEKWMNPSPDLLKTPINFISTNDIIGGNSGSPIINRDKEVVGLIFDGNIESLPGNFIFSETTSRSVSVHTAGMMAALQYVYNADRIAMELLGKK